MKSKKKNEHKKSLVRYLIIVILLVFLMIASDSRLKVVYYDIDTDKVDSDVRIALITDLHSCKYGRNQETLINAVREENPDVVLLGGDIFDDEVLYDNAVKFLTVMAAEYPCYYVSGNHEYWTEEIEVVKRIVRDLNIPVLEGECMPFTVRDETINICGIDDSTRLSSFELTKQLTTASAEAGLTGTVTEPAGQDESTIKSTDYPAGECYYTILLTHRPELFSKYQNYGFDLVLAGHAHGGQWRIPGILNGVYSPNQGWFPKYAGGRYEENDTTMIVSRGLARESTKAPRIFNRPELVMITIR